jgi:hypothetical protein
MTSLINLNVTNIVQNGFNNNLRFSLGGSGANFAGSEIAIDSIQLFNSQFNISASLYSNNLFSITLPTAATTSVISIDLGEGIYDYNAINQFVQGKLIAAGAYLVDTGGSYIYYVQIQSNSTYYSCQIDLSPVPTTVPAGWSRPATGLYSSGGSGLPTTAYCPQITIPSGLDKAVGFNPGTYPSTQQTASQSLLSQFCPQINPVSSYVVRCNLINNQYTVPSDIMTSFTNRGTSAGDVIEITPNERTWFPIADGVRSYIDVTIVDQYQRFVKFKDPQISINLLLRPLDTGATRKGS